MASLVRHFDNFLVPFKHADIAGRSKVIAHIARLGIEILMNSRCGAACTSGNEDKPLVTTYVLEKYEDSWNHNYGGIS